MYTPGLGDPAAMREAASVLRRQAGRIRDLQTGLAAHATGFTFEGPAAVRYEARMRAHLQPCSGRAAELESLAGALDASAVQVEAEQVQIARAEAARQAQEALRRLGDIL
jgi:uncharacterized protein YukE